MRKIKKKTCIFASLMVGFATFATYKAYKAYYVDLSEQDLIVLENVLAITDAPPKPNLVYVQFEKKWCWIPTSHEIHNTKGEVIGIQHVYPYNGKEFYRCGYISLERYKEGNWTICTPGADDTQCEGVETSVPNKPKDEIIYY